MFTILYGEGCEWLRHFLNFYHSIFEKVFGIQPKKNRLHNAIISLNGTLCDLQLLFKMP